MSHQQTLNTIDAIDRIIELGSIIEKLTEEKKILTKQVSDLKTALTKINNLVSPPKLLNHCDHVKKLDEIFGTGNNVEELFKYTNFNRKYMRVDFCNFINSNNLPVLKYFIDNYEDLEYADSDNWKLIHYFTSLNCEEIIIYMLNKNVKLNDVAMGRFTPIEFICRSSSFRVIHYMICKGIKLGSEHIKLINNNRKLTSAEKITLIN